MTSLAAMTTNRTLRRSNGFRVGQVVELIIASHGRDLWEIIGRNHAKRSYTLAALSPDGPSEVLDDVPAALVREISRPGSPVFTAGRGGPRR